jgi:hypothetical protein
MAIIIEQSKGKNVTYIINTDKKTVKAILHTDACEPQKAFDKIYYNLVARTDITPIRPVDNYQEDYCTNSKYVGISKCHGTDVFDADFGKKLALARAKKKHYLAHLRQMRRMRRAILELNMAMGPAVMAVEHKLDLATTDEETLVNTKA